MTRFAWILCSCLVLVGCGSTTQDPSEILRVRADRVLDRDQKPVWLRGLQFTNDWTWDGTADQNPASTPVDESDYQRAAAIGVNTLSFFLRSDQFEGDAAPYQYREDGFDWLDQNIAWAKASGIRLVLTLATTPGSPQWRSPCDGNTVWDVPDYQARMVALWQVIARRYANEPAVAGYDPLAYPISSGPVDQWHSLAKQLTAAIRAVDRRHIVVIETPLGADCNYTFERGAADLFRMEDGNVLYATDANFPWAYVAQLLPSKGLGDGGFYPDDTQPNLDWGKACNDSSCDLEWKDSTWNSTPRQSQLLLKPDQTSWTEQRFAYRVTNPDYQIGEPVLQSDNNPGKVYFDDFIINEYDQDLNFVRTVLTVDLEDLSAWYLWQGDADGNRCADCGGLVALESDAHQGRASISVSGTTSGASLSDSSAAFQIRLNYTYEMRGWIKGKNSSPTGASAFRLDFWKYNQQNGVVPMRNRDSLAQYLQSFVDWGKAQRVPLYVNNYFSGRPTFSNDKGGLRWVEDMTDLLKANNFHFAYGAYRDDEFGIYPAAGDLSDPAAANQPLIDLLTRELMP
jgi:endoglucanase